MTSLRSLERFVSKKEEGEGQSQDDPKMQQLVEKCHNLPFYRWIKNSDPRVGLTHRGDNIPQFVTYSQPYSGKGKSKDETRLSCCFNHAIGLPTKNGIVKPLYDYEKLLFDALEIPHFLNTGLGHTENKKTNVNDAPLYPQKVGHLALVKATSIGATEFFIRYICWKCMVNDDLKGSDVCIITGPREQLSIDIIDRIRKLFLPHGITFDTKQTTLFINNVRIRSYPSNRLQDMRGLPNVSIIYCDEASFFGPESQSQVLDVCERYAGKSGAKIILCSTPNKSGDLMHQLISQPWEQSFYKIVKLDYTYTLGKLLSEEDIRIAKASISFEREYNLTFSFGSGNIFGPKFIDRAIELGKKYDPVTVNKWAQHSLGIDTGFGSSSCAFCVLEYSDNIIKVVYADQFERSSFNDMVQKVLEIQHMVGGRNALDNVYIDGSNTAFVEAVKQELGEDSNWYHIHDKIAWCKKEGLNISDHMRVVPVSFSQESASMLSRTKSIIEHEDSLIAINEKWDKLITALRGAIANQNNKLDKSESPLTDMTDSFILACKFFNLQK